MEPRGPAPYLGSKPHLPPGKARRASAGASVLVLPLPQELKQNVCRSCCPVVLPRKVSALNALSTSFLTEKAPVTVEQLLAFVPQNFVISYFPRQNAAASCISE